MGPGCLAHPADPNQSAERSIGQVFDLVDPPLWLVTAADNKHRGGLIATLVVRASIVSGLPRMVAGVAKQHHTRDARIDAEAIRSSRSRR
ncbi:MAG: hypothetical protein U9Q81_02900, partial [Pseudomonadota bacterium]|nr:hypothetical protein [Pseudomonadota bacterium]